jgi:hypothetical protein
VIVGVLLVIFSGGGVAGLLWSLLDTFTGNLKATMVDPHQISEALVTMFAGGMGSQVYAIRAYLLHACDRKDFDQAYIPWYIFWSLQGALLGLIFYFAVRGGILLVGAESPSPVNLNTWSLAAIGALVGLFSKYAIEKLRQVFIITFTSKAVLDKDEKENRL